MKYLRKGLRPFTDNLSTLNQRTVLTWWLRTAHTIRLIPKGERNITDEFKEDDEQNDRNVDNQIIKR